MINYRATTPTFWFHFPEVITNYDDVLITFWQNEAVIFNKTASDLVLDEDNTYGLTLTQQESKQFAPGLFYIQTRVRKGTEVAASKKYRAKAEDVFNDTVLGGNSDET